MSFINPNELNSHGAGVSYRSYADELDEYTRSLGVNSSQDPFFGDNILNSFSAFPPPQPYQDADADAAAAQQQLLDSITEVDISDFNFTPQLSHPNSTGFPFPQQPATNTSNTSPSTSHSSPHISSPSPHNSSPSTNTTTPEAAPHRTAPKKRGRKKQIHKTDAEIQQARKKFLERNRQAASKCREKKKESTGRLEQRAHFLHDEQERLKSDVYMLREEVQRLRAVALPHTQKCGGLDASQNASGYMDLDGMEFTTEPEDGDGDIVVTTPAQGDEKVGRGDSMDSAVDLSTPQLV